MNRIGAILLALGLFLPGTGYSQERAPVQVQLPSHYPEQLGRRGVVDSVAARNGGFIVISGTRYAVDSGAIIHFLEQPYGTLAGIKPGMGVAYELIQVGNTKKIGKLWELPPGLMPPPS